MGKPVIAYKSMLRSTGVVITDPGTEAGFSLADIHDYRSYSLWKSDTTSSPIDIDIDLAGGDESVDYIMLVNHNLFTETATVEVFSGAAFPPAASWASFAPTEDTVSFKTAAASVTRRYWRVRITAFVNKPFIGELFLGMKTTLPQYLAPSFDPFFKQVEARGFRSRGGHYLGVSLKGQQHRGEITFGEAGAPRADFTSDLNAFLDDHAFKRRPFGFIVDPDDSDFDKPRYVKMVDEEEASRNAVGGTWSNLTFVLPIEEAYAEPA